MEVRDELGHLWIVERGDPGWKWRKYAPTALSIPMLLGLPLDNERERLQNLLRQGWNPDIVGDILVVLQA